MGIVSFTAWMNSQQPRVASVGCFEPTEVTKSQEASKTGRGVNFSSRRVATQPNRREAWDGNFLGMLPNMNRGKLQVFEREVVKRLRGATAGPQRS